MTKATNKEQHRYGIGAVARLTGLTDHTIRVWERRYGAVVARRAPNGRRIYEPADVEKLGLLKRLTDEGLAIRDIAGDSLHALRERVRGLGELVGAPLPERIGVAVLGEYLPVQLSLTDVDLAPLDVHVSDTDRNRFVSDVAGHDVDVVILESPVLDADVIAHLQELLDLTGASGGVLVFSFGKARDVEHARDSRIVVLRAPIDVVEARAAALRAYSPAAPARRAPAPPEEARESQWDTVGPIAARRFNRQQLMTLAQASTSIDCECPHHLAQIVGDLTAFEIYSANCANRGEEDAALHRFLHHTTAQARQLMEIALERVATAEGIEY